MTPVYEAPLDKIGEESPWQGYRHQVQAPNHDIKYCKNHLQITQYSDMVNRDTNKMFTWDEWEDFVEIAETQRLDGQPDPWEVMLKTNMIFGIQSRIPRDVRRALEVPRDTRNVKRGDRIYVTWVPKFRSINHDINWPAIVTGDNLAQRVRIDKVGKAHRTQQHTLLQPFTVSHAMMWKDRWIGPEGTGYLYTERSGGSMDKRTEKGYGCPS